MTEQLDCIVVGAGVVGLAVARRLAMAGREVLCLESAEAIGTGVSARNSEVIHAGLYYPPGSLKARTCVPGRDALYRFCTANGVRHRRIGKLIVATSHAQRERLAQIRLTAERNGLTDLRLLDAAETCSLEPDLHAVAALLSPSTGIVDSHAFMLSLQGEAEAHDASFVLRSSVIGGYTLPDGWIRLHVDAGGERIDLEARLVINAAGLGAQRVAQAIRGVPPETVPRLYLAKGNYFSLAGRAPFQHLIYPVPEPGGLGIHLTLDLGGQARFGPDVEWVDRLEYSVDAGRADRFDTAIRSYWPDLPTESLRADYAGIRPKLVGPGEPAADFIIQDQRDHGVDGLINLYGIESPGLTAALALADEVAARTTPVDRSTLCQRR